MATGCRRKRLALIFSFWTVAECSSLEVQPKAYKILGTTQKIRSFFLRVGRTRQLPTGLATTVWILALTQIQTHTKSYNAKNPSVVTKFTGITIDCSCIAFVAHFQCFRQAYLRDVWRLISRPQGCVCETCSTVSAPA